MAEERREYQVPPTRPSTPLHRDPRIAEAPSRADPSLSLMSMSSPSHAIVATAHYERDPVNHDLAERNEGEVHHIATSSNPTLAMVNGNSHGQSNPDMTLSSCTDRFYVPTPHNSPVRRNNRQSVLTSAMTTSRLRGGGAPKRGATSPRGSAAKKKKVSGGKGRAKKSKDDVFDDSEGVLADGNSPLYDDLNIAAILQHPLAQITLAGTPVGAQLQALSLDDLRRTATVFRNDGRSGFNDPEHLRQGLAAVQRRVNGDFDEFSKQKFVETWIDDGDSSNSEQELARDLNAFSSTGPTTSNSNMKDTHEVRHLNAFNNMSVDASNENVEDAQVAQDLDVFGSMGPHASNEDKADKADEQEEEEHEESENKSSKGEYDSRPSHHHREDEDDPDGPAASGASQEPSDISMQQEQTSEAHTSNGQGSGNNQSGQTRTSWEAYFSNYVDVTAPPRHAITSIVSPLKLDAMCRKQEHVGVKFQDIIKAGDILLLEIAGQVVKEVTLVKEHAGHFVIAVPPGAHVRSEPRLRVDVIYPSPNNNEKITGPTQICKIVERLVGLGADRPAWKSLYAVHEGEVLGNITDIRQALEWSWAEGDFRAQLQFEKFRRRRLKPAHQEDGFEFINRSSLFRKVRTSELARHNHDLIIDLGPRLNDKLARCADSHEFTIIMVDNRLVGSDGLFPADGVDIDQAFNQGHLSFPTRFCRDLAGSEGWSNGHAHIGPLGLGKGIGHSVWEGGKRNASCKGAGWLNVAALNADTTPPGVRWSSAEMRKVTEFHESNVRGQIRHFPIPINRSRRHWGLQPQQFRRIAPGQWILDPDFPHQGLALTNLPSTRSQLGTMSSRNPQSTERARQLQNQPRQPRRPKSALKDISQTHHGNRTQTQPPASAMAQHLPDADGLGDFAFNPMNSSFQLLDPSIDDQDTGEDNQYSSDAGSDSNYYPEDSHYHTESPTMEPIIPYFSKPKAKASNNDSRYQQVVERQVEPQQGDAINYDHPVTLIDPLLLDNEPHGGDAISNDPITLVNPLLLNNEHPRPSADPRSDPYARSLAESAAHPSIGSPSEGPKSPNPHWFYATAAQLKLECYDGKPKSWVPPSHEHLLRFFTSNNLRLLPHPVSRGQDSPNALYPSVTEEGVAVFATRDWFGSQVAWEPVNSGLAVRCFSPTYGPSGIFNGWAEIWVDAFSDPRLVRPYDFPDQSVLTWSPLASGNESNNSRSEQPRYATSQLPQSPLGLSSPHRSTESISSHSFAGSVSRALSYPESSTTIEAVETLQVQAKAALTWNPQSAAASVTEKAVKDRVAFEAEKAAPKPRVEVYNKAKYNSGSYAGLSLVGAASMRQPLTTKATRENHSATEHRAKRARLTQEMTERTQKDSDDAYSEEELTKATAPSA